MKYEQHCPLLMVQSRHHNHHHHHLRTNQPTIATRMRTTMFQCTWRHCGFESGHREEMLQHVRKQHMGISGCSADDEEDFYYTEIELDSPIDSSGISSGQSIEPLSPSTRCCENCGCHSVFAMNTNSNSTIVNGNRAVNRSSSPMPTSPLKRSPSTWMHLDMARPAHEDPEYRQRLAQAQLHRHATINRKSSAYLSTHPHLLTQANHNNNIIINNNHNNNTNSANSIANHSQPIALQQQNAVHLQHNLQHLQANLARHKRGRKQTNSTSSHSSLSTVSSSIPLDDRSLHVFDHLQPFELQPVPVKRSKPIQVPALAAHRRPKSPASFSTPFTVGSVQNSPRSYFHCISPSSLGSPSGSSCSSGSAVSFSSLCSVAAAASSINDHSSMELTNHTLQVAPVEAIEAVEADNSLHSIESYDSAYGCDPLDLLPANQQEIESQPPEVQAELELHVRALVNETAANHAIDDDELDESDELYIDLPEDDQLNELLEEREESTPQVQTQGQTPQTHSNEIKSESSSSSSSSLPSSQAAAIATTASSLFEGETDALTKLAESAVHALVNVKRMQQRNAAARAAAEQAAAMQCQQMDAQSPPQPSQQAIAQTQFVQQVHSQQVYNQPLEYTYASEYAQERAESNQAQNVQEALERIAQDNHRNRLKQNQTIKSEPISNCDVLLDDEEDDDLEDDDLVDDEEDIQADDEEEVRPSLMHKKRANYEALLSDHQYRQAIAVCRSSNAANNNARFAGSRHPRMVGRPARYEQAVRRAYERRYSFTPVKIGSVSNNAKLTTSGSSGISSTRRPVGRPPKSLYSKSPTSRTSISIPSNQNNTTNNNTTTISNTTTTSNNINTTNNTTSVITNANSTIPIATTTINSNLNHSTSTVNTNTASGLPSNRRPPGRPKGSGKTQRLLQRETAIVSAHRSISMVSTSNDTNSDLNGSFDSTFNSTLGSSAEVESIDSGLGGTSSSDLNSPVQRQASAGSNASLTAARFKNSTAKCRKKFGMENKHQWCTQCKWKKACSRVAAAAAAAAAALSASASNESARLSMNQLVQTAVRN